MSSSHRPTHPTSTPPAASGPTSNAAWATPPPPAWTTSPATVVFLPLVPAQCAPRAGRRAADFAPRRGGGSLLLSAGWAELSTLGGDGDDVGIGGIAQREGL